uniref:UDP-glycosyltransferases domain-containing protein n=1 Tax=Salix viminalis TaxID=40686 RepID=A0A6N2KJ40_SALVM
MFSEGSPDFLRTTYANDIMVSYLTGEIKRSSRASAIVSKMFTPSYSGEPNSVMCVNFGSITEQTPQQMLQFAWDIANSKQPFLWIIRPAVGGCESRVLPPEFLAETRGRGNLASWCPQEKILKHPSIGGFASHIGWKSMLESRDQVEKLVRDLMEGERATEMKKKMEWKAKEEAAAWPGGSSSLNFEKLPGDILRENNGF